MKNVSDKVVILSVFVLFVVLLFCGRAKAQQFEYKGVYVVQEILTTYCDDCYLQLPPDYLQQQIVMAVSTDDEKSFFRSLQTSSRAVGWELVRKKDGMLKAEQVLNDGMMIFISCMDKQPHNVPKYMYQASVKADKMQCQERDSLLQIARYKAMQDSLKIDSLSKIPPLDFESYELKYFAYSKSFTDKLGVEWSTVLSSGNLRGRLEFFDDWRMFASATEDTTFTERSIIFSVDSTLSIDWGTEEQTIKQTFVNDGVTTQDYEWRKYGLIVKVNRDGKRVKMDYIFRDKDNSVSVLQGSVIGLQGDTLRLFGTYNTNRQIQNGVPFLSTVPILGNLFKVEQTVVDRKAFELYLLPKKAVKDDEQSNKMVSR